jgi:hypothetical protein
MKNSLELFNAMKAEAKQLGINIQGMKKPEIEQAIRDAQARFEEENEGVEDVGEVEIASVVKAEVKRPGRPVNESSTRQVRLNELAKLREEGLLKRGRPANPESARYKRMMDRQAKLEAGVELKRGRPKMVKA